MRRIFNCILLFLFVSVTHAQQYVGASGLVGCGYSIKAYQQKDKYYLQIGRDKAILIGKLLTRDAARTNYQQALMTALTKKCPAAASGSPTDLIAYTEDFAGHAADSLLFRASAIPKPPPTELSIADSIRLDPSRKLVLIRTLKDKYELSLLNAGSPSKVLLKWDSAARQYDFQAAGLADDKIQLALPLILYLKDSVAGIASPGLGMLYKPDNSYTLLTVDSAGVATLLEDNVKGTTGDSLQASGGTSKIQYHDVKINILPVKVTAPAAGRSAGSPKPAPAAKPAAANASAANASGANAAATNSPAPDAGAAQPASNPSSAGKPAAAAKDSTEQGEDTTFHAGITFLNAFNFDFSNKFTTSYLGLLNIYSPHAFRGKKDKDQQSWFNRNWGLDLGFEKINYSNANINGNDSSRFEFFHQNILRNPLDLYRAPNSANDTLLTGAKYTRMLNKYTFSSSNTVYSFYAQFLFNTHLVEDTSDRKIGIFAHAHFEFLVNRYTKTANIQTIAQDSTGVVGPTQTHNINGFNYYMANQIVTNYNFISPYFGVGLTGYLQPFPHYKNTHLFGEITFGYALNTPMFSNLLADTILPALNGTYNLQTYYPYFKGFYLVRLGLMQSITANSDLMIGFNLRSDFGTESKYAQYAIYAGINLGLTPIIQAITGGSGSGGASK